VGASTDRLSNLTTAIVSDALVRLGLPIRALPAVIRPLAPEMRCWGPARTVRHFGSVDIFLEAFEAASPGDVLVIDNENRDDEGCIGDLTVIEAATAGLAGIVVWGRHRDSAELRRIGWPVFSTGTCAAGPAGGRPRSSVAFGPLGVGPVSVAQDDVILADEDAVLVLDPASLDDVLAAAEAIATTERRQAAAVSAGRSLRSQLRFDEYLAARTAEPHLTFREHLRRVGGAIEE
jgi:4-hydroxy-4-methyl-2-oxoglutarate aldolase